MKHMNPKLAKLLYEGFSMSTLENLNTQQLNALYQRISEQKGSVKMKNPNPEQVKQYTDQGVNVEIGEEEVTEKAVSKKQQKAMAIALKAKQGEFPKSKLKKSAKEMFKMSEKDLEDFAKTKTSKLPNEVKEDDDVKKLEESILRLIESHLPPHTTKGELLKIISKKR